jgi:cysteine desulfurase / selenocysteine lyase
MRTEEFPILNQRIDGKRLVYLDSAATTQKPTSVIEAITAYYTSDNANVHRAQHTLAARATSAYEGARKKIRDFINAQSDSEIVFTHGTTEALNLLAQSFGKTMESGDAVLLTEMEHHSNLIPWQLMAAERGVELRFLPFNQDGKLEYSELEKIWDEKIKIVGVTHVSNVFGTINDVGQIIEFAHKKGVPVLLDGAQAIGHMPVDVRDLECDFYAFSGHKMCGPTGIGILYGKEELLQKLEPFMGGGEMITAVWLDRAQWNELPYKFEAGTPNIAGAVGFGAAVDYLSAIGMEVVEKHESALTSYAVEKLKSVKDLTLYGPEDDRCGVFSFNLGEIHAHDVAQFLDNNMVAVRAGHHCAHPLMRKLGVTSTARASLYLYNEREDIDILADSLSECGDFFKHGI